MNNESFSIKGELGVKQKNKYNREKVSVLVRSIGRFKKNEDGSHDAYRHTCRNECRRKTGRDGS